MGINQEETIPISIRQLSYGKLKFNPTHLICTLDVKLNKTVSKLL